ncbi:hypothetical protein [Hoyosella subflava]|uniref:Uncharacterized protein n=1 Tax=Hoyosella subflava (strain DSM 45089 / JCM 17490 / NBRC 109087 / DQS3-9A1) TaxID=443218 RepID=F6ENB6_HOYSD|nr:hypothetical protein [Hoyosella subflava]AEF40387.1 hypothetical protein AS9A_1938 [Hoyosella subflava DQS3-9A1]
MRPESRGGKRHRSFARAEELERRFALPVLIAAIVSVPAVFLTLFEGAVATTGTVLNWLSAVIILGESLILLFVSGDAIRWARRHWWTLAIALVTVPAVLLAFGPVQVLRALMWVGAIRLFRVGRIIKAGRILSERTELGQRRTRALIGVLTVLAAVFVFVALADPGSETRQIATWTVNRVGVVPTIIAGAILFAATVITLRYRSSRQDSEETSDEHEDGARPGDHDT